AWADRYLHELERNDLASAMVTVIKGTGDIGLPAALPRLVLVPLISLAIRADATKRADRIPIRDLLPTVRFDARLQREASQLVPMFSHTRCQTLLMGGERSHPSLRAAMDALARRMPHAVRVTLAGEGHLAADNRGDPARVAAELYPFFTLAS